MRGQGGDPRFKGGGGGGKGHMGGRGNPGYKGVVNWSEAPARDTESQYLAS